MFLVAYLVHLPLRVLQVHQQAHYWFTHICAIVISYWFIYFCCTVISHRFTHICAISIWRWFTKIVESWICDDANREMQRKNIPSFSSSDIMILMSIHDMAIMLSDNEKSYVLCLSKRVRWLACCLWGICRLIFSGWFNWKIEIGAGWRCSLMVMATPLYFELLITCDVTSVCDKGPYT